MATQNLPLVSVVLETYNAESGGEIEFQQVLDQLRKQTYPRERIEVILVVDEENVSLTRTIEERFPWARVVHMEDSTYYGMKVRGMAMARGDILALTDTDCALESDYVEKLVRNFEAGADVVVGKVRFSPDAWFSKTFDLFCFAHVKADDEGLAQAFSVNNVAFTRQVADEYPFDARIRRSGGAYLLCRQLRAAGRNVVYDPDIVVHHDAHDLKFQIMMRIRTGYEVVNLLTIDDGGVLPESRLRRFGLFAPVVSSARRFLIDMKVIAADRRDLGISIPEIPYFVAASFVIRNIEAAAGLLTVFKPNWLADRYGW